MTDCHPSSLTARFASRAVNGAVNAVSHDAANQPNDALPAPPLAPEQRQATRTRSCIIKSPWLRRGGLIAILFFLIKGLFWLGLLWWYHQNVFP